MILKEIFDKGDWKNIKVILSKFYKLNDINLLLHQSVFDKMKVKTIGKSKLFLNIELVKKFDELYYHVNAITLPNESNKIDNYSLMFTPWKDWLSMGVSQDTIETLSFDEIIAHCLYEMTYIHFDERKIKKEFNKLLKLKADIKNGTLKTTPLDEFLKSLKD